MSEVCLLVAGFFVPSQNEFNHVLTFLKHLSCPQSSRNHLPLNPLLKKTDFQMKKALECDQPQMVLLGKTCCIYNGHKPGSPEILWPAWEAICPFHWVGPVKLSLFFKRIGDNRAVKCTQWFDLLCSGCYITLHFGCSQWKVIHRSTSVCWLDYQCTMYHQGGKKTKLNGCSRRVWIFHPVPLVSVSL